jgi:dipeptidyl aminopeptidase/acylaminoacyl peptidase
VTLPPLIPRAVLFGNPDRTNPTLSPDGTRLGYVAPEEGVLNVYVGPADGSRPAEAVTHDRDRGIREYLFCHDDRTLVYLRDTGGDEDWRIYALDLVTGGTRLLTPKEKVQAKIVAHNRWHPGTMLVGLNKDDPQLHDLYRLDLATGALRLDTRNPGFLEWLVDTDLVARGGVAMQPDGSVVLMRRADPTGEEWVPFLEVPADDATATDPVGFDRAGDALYLVTTLDADTSRLLRLDWHDGSRTVVAADPQHDVVDVWRHPATRQPQAVVLKAERDRIVTLDPELDADLAVLRGLGDGELGANRSHRLDTRWLVSVAPSDGPVRYHLYERSAGTTTYLFAHLDALEDYELAPMEPFSFTARDGLTVHGYLTFPRGVDRSGLPAVLDVHGGPWARDDWGYNPDAQWLANRGYLCVQVNYRGSTGYGKTFLKAGDKQWGRAMHDDLVDAVQHVVAQGWVDGDRVGIMGGSYGGYAALAGAAFTPELFRCAIDLVGPSNLLTLLASVPDYWAPMRAMLHQKVGHPETERDLLWDRSPLAHVDRIRIPVLVAQGANDPRVKQAEAEQIVAALAAKGLPHEYLLFPDEGHGLAKPGNREVFYSVAERFLAEHLGGRSE